MHGKGTWTYENGDIYVGDFLENEMHGYGIYTLKNGKKYSSTWKAGEGYFCRWEIFNQVGEEDWIE